jgi:hypothetical protein
MRIEIIQAAYKAASDPNNLFDLGFEAFLKFIGENPETQAAQDFAKYHEIEQDNPDDFLYLVGESFVVGNWIENDDEKKKFFEFVKAAGYEIEDI